MKQKFLLKTMLLLCALVAGSGTMWATPTTYNFSSIPTTGWSTSGGNQTINNISWSYSSATYIGNNNSRIQVGSKNNPQTSDWTIQTPISNFGSNKAITAISITAYTTATTATYDISVGGSSVKSGSLTTSSATYSATGLNVTSGDIVVTMTGSSNSKAMYLSNISVTYDDAVTDPVIGASDVEIDAEATAGEFAYTISNPVANTTLSASVTSGDWLSNPQVSNGKVTFTTTQNASYTESRTGTIHLVYGDNLATKDVTITQAAAIHKYIVTIEAPTNGTLVVKNGETAISSGAELADGTTLSIETTPANGYRFKNWQAVDGSTHTFTANFTYTINAHDVTIKANFELIPTHRVTFYDNGTQLIDYDESYTEGDDIIFPDAPSVGSYDFIGWATAEINGTATEAPSTVTSATMGTADVTYYAVYGDVENVTATFDASDISNLTEDDDYWKWTENSTGIVLSLAGDGSQLYTNGNPHTFTVGKGTSKYFQIEVDGKITSVVTTVSGANYVIGSVSAGTLATNTDGTTQTVTFSNNASISTLKCYATNNYQIRATKIEVEADLITAYMTTLPTYTVTISSFGWASYIAEKNVYFNSNVSAYIATGNSGNSVTLTEVAAVQSGTPVVVKAKNAIESSQTFTLETVDADDCDDVSANLLEVCDGTAAEDGYNYFVLAKNEGSACFKQWTGALSTLNGRVVLPLQLDLTTQGGARALNIVFSGEATGIDTIEHSTMTIDSYYNLSGQRVETPKKGGLYIVNGKKVVIK